jgi:hypothetical protein
MPIVVKLETADGRVLETLPDPGEVLHRTLPNYDDPTFRVLTKIDWYGDAEFEASQMDHFLEELERIMPSASGPEQTDYLERLKGLALRCAAAPGCKLKFLGD